jgi:hypothetical protein
MGGPVQLDRKSEARAIQIDYEAANALLPAELQAQKTSVANHGPGASLGLGTLSSQTPSALSVMQGHRRTDHHSRDTEFGVFHVYLSDKAQRRLS